MESTQDKRAALQTFSNKYSRHVKWDKTTILNRMTC